METAPRGQRAQRLSVYLSCECDSRECSVNTPFRVHSTATVSLAGHGCDTESAGGRRPFMWCRAA
eukprot:259746-Prymnesium_polylepis.1